MPLILTRRAALASAAAMLLPGSPWALATPADTAALRLAEIEARIGGRLGVAVLDTGSGVRIAHRADELFPMCSTFKCLAAAAVLHEVDAGRLRLDQRLPYATGDLLDYAPVTRAHVGDGGMALIFSTQFMDEATRHGDRTVALGGGDEFMRLAKDDA